MGTGGYMFSWFSPLWEDTYRKMARKDAWLPGEEEEEGPPVAPLEKRIAEDPQALLQNTPDMPILEDATEHLYQLNHVYVVPQSKSDTMTINEGRLFARPEMWDF